MPLATEPIVLKGGHVVQLAAVLLLLDLESRGFEVSTDGSTLVVAPRVRLTPKDDRAIRKYRDELCALVSYCEAIGEF